jgi:hypothetical protein
MFTEKLVIPEIELDTASVMTAAVDWPAFSDALCLFHEIVRYDPAFEGLQPDADRPKVSTLFPVFLTYTVLLIEAPGSIIPQSIELSTWEHALSEYTSTLIALTVPLLPIDLDEVSTPVTASAPARAKTTDTSTIASCGLDPT